MYLLDSDNEVKEELDWQVWTQHILQLREDLELYHTTNAATVIALLVISYGIGEAFSL